MMEAWLLIMLLASGEMAIEPMTTERACDAERADIARAADAAELRGVCPMVVAAECRFALASPEFFPEGGE